MCSSGCRVPPRPFIPSPPVPSFLHFGFFCGTDACEIIVGAFAAAVAPRLIVSAFCCCNRPHQWDAAIFGVLCLALGGFLMVGGVGGVVRDLFFLIHVRTNVSLLCFVSAEPFCSSRTGVLCCSAHDRTGGLMFCAWQKVVVGLFCFLFST